ncbi:hypothetical protein [Pararhizobium sp. PWRC1-1]|uniref:hypothetical protein n=1 Tax=Pararhizobium sp. PWRC1-1 TaxID=2804566 RepID=UPI003CFB8A3A
MTAFAIGLLAAGTRSLICYCMTPWLIIIAFALAAICSPGNVSLLALGLAIVAYNTGMAATFLIALVVALRSEA